MITRKRLRELPLHLMILPGLVLIVLFSYVPMAGIIIAFQKFIPAKGLFGDQRWVGLDNFRYVWNLPSFKQVLWNTFFISSLKLILGLIVPIAIAILLNELKNEAVKRSVQTIIYLPYFLSWVVLSGILIDILSPSTGIVNGLLSALGMKKIFFLGDNHWFPFTLILSDIWKNFGYGTIVYLAAITGIDPGLYESATIDGASRWNKMWHITLPGMRMVIVLLSVLSLGQSAECRIRSSIQFVQSSGLSKRGHSGYVCVSARIAGRPIWCGNGGRAIQIARIADLDFRFVLGRIPVCKI
ncbi:ABC transporter permease subunit [Paenibacillus sp. P25]|nr:ABC transporter permease subunit [Paenibacillus sp. P25]